MALDFSRFDPATFTGISEANVLADAYPPYGFVRQWMDYMYETSDAPLVYALGAGISTLSVLVPPNICLPDADELKANMFVMLVGPSANARKTFAVRHIREQLQHSDVGGGDFVLGEVGSKEGYIDDVIANPRRIIMAEEGGNFLQHTANGQYGQQIRAQLCSVFDCSPLQRNTVGAKKSKGDNKTPRQDNPRVSMLMGLTKAHLENYTYQSDWADGFLSRYVTLWARRERNFEGAKLNEARRAAMRSYLCALMNVVSGGKCAGLKPEAQDYFRTWQRSITAYASRQGDKTIGVVERAQVHARKAALVLAYDRHIAQSGGHNLQTLVATHCDRPWYVDVCDVAVGTALGTYSMLSALHIERNITDNEDGQIMNRIVNYIAENAETGAATLPEILRFTNRPIRHIQGYLETLVAAERLGKTVGAKGTGGTTEVFFVPDSKWAHENRVTLGGVSVYGTAAPLPTNNPTKH